MFRSSVLKGKALVILVSTIAISQWAQANTLVIGLASSSEVKKRAVEETFQKLFPESTLELDTYSAASEIADQPVGESNGILGARNRLKNAKQLSGLKHYDYWVSIENYIGQPKAPSDSWFDQAVVILEKNGKTGVIEKSREVPFEAELGEQARLATPENYPYLDSGFSVTSGKMIQAKLAKEGMIVAHDDWHAYYGGNSRKELIKEVIFKALVRSEIDTVVDFKKKGVQYQELTDIMYHPALFQAVVDAMIAPYEGLKIDAVAALESRGWFFGIPMAMKLKVPFYPIRKKGKLAKPTHSVTYKTEYSEDEMEISVDSFNGKTILVVDDVLATGGSIRAAEDLLRQAGAGTMYSTCLVELLNFSGRNTLSSDFTAFIKY